MIKCILFCLFLGQTLGFNSDMCRDKEHEEWFCSYMQKHNKTYLALEVPSRKKLLKHRHHSYNVDGVTFGLTSRSDRFFREKKFNMHLQKSTHRSLQRPWNAKHSTMAAPSKLPPLDWRNVDGRSYVSPIKDQGDCGGCFAFASATVLEYWSKKQGTPQSLSPQILMDCTSHKSLPDDGCEGGLMEYVFEYARRHPVPLETDRPFLNADNECPNEKLMSYVQVKNHKVLMKSTVPAAERQLEALLYSYGPLSVGIDSRRMENYKSGIFKSHMCGKDIDHAVTIVGFTDSAWIVKNSWGSKWGMDGYIHIERGKNACGIAEYVVYVTDATPIHKKEWPKWNWNDGWDLF